MPRYFFHIHDGQDIPDDEGADFPSLTAARIEAVALAGKLLADHGDDFWKSSEWQMDVTDERGLLLFTLMFSGAMAAAAKAMS